MNKRPVIEHHKPSPEDSRRRQQRLDALKARATLSVSLTIHHADGIDRRELAQAHIDAWIKAYADASDGAAAQSALGVAARRAEPFQPVRPRRELRDAVFRGVVE